MLRVRVSVPDLGRRAAEAAAAGLSWTSSDIEASLRLLKGLHREVAEPPGVFITFDGGLDTGWLDGARVSLGDAAVVEADPSRVVLKLSMEVTLFLREAPSAKGMASR